MPSNKDILLFYKEFEADKFLPGDRYLKRLLRPVYNAFHHKQKKTGFAVSFELLCKALRASGYHVHVNNYRLARQRPDYPVGIVGFPLILDDWHLPNPALLGPSLYDHPGLAPNLFDDKRFRKLLVLGDWTYDMFEAIYRGKCIKWFAGIDLEAWPDRSGAEKTIDFIVYDKIRWDHDSYEYSLIDPLCRLLEEKNLSYERIRYKFHDHATYQKLLERARGMIFLCEHETQGLAYQEALASGVPILAWDRGYWADPLWQKFQDTAPAASSVPFFSDSCGEKFKNMDDFESMLDLFMNRRSDYDPRSYVRENLSFRKSADIYQKAYFELAS